MVGRGGHPITWREDQQFHDNVTTVSWCYGARNPHPKCLDHANDPTEEE